MIPNEMCQLLFEFNVVSGAAVEQFVEALPYKPEGRGFDSRWCHWNFSVDSASNRNE
jgi:hypothetical protein